MQENEIEFIVDVSSETVPTATQTKGRIRDASIESFAAKAIPVDLVKENMTRVSEAAVEFLSDIRKVGDFQLAQVQLQVEVSAEGGVQLIGTAKAGGKGAITLTFERPETIKK